MKPEVLALVLVVVMASIGTYIIYSPKTGLPSEGFSPDSRAAALLCEKSYNECLKAGTSIESCTKQSSVCLSAITNPSVSTAPNAPSTGKATGSSSAASVGQTTPKPSADYTAMATAALTGTEQKLSSEWDSFLKQVQSKLGSSAVKPTGQQLDLVQGAGITPTAPITTSYQPSVTVIKPHEQVPKQLATLTAIAQTDKDTQAQQITNAMNAFYTPSVRQMIRDDVKDVVREEVEANQINNPYAIDYQMY